MSNPELERDVERLKKSVFLASGKPNPIPLRQVILVTGLLCLGFTFCVFAMMMDHINKQNSSNWELQDRVQRLEIRLDQSERVLRQHGFISSHHAGQAPILSDMTNVLNNRRLSREYREAGHGDNT